MVKNCSRLTKNMDDSNNNPKTGKGGVTAMEGTANDDDNGALTGGVSRPTNEATTNPSAQVVVGVAGLDSLVSEPEMNMAPSKRKADEITPAASASPVAIATAVAVAWPVFYRRRLVWKRDQWGTVVGRMWIGDTPEVIDLTNQSD
jgi:hypothetical protein